MNLINRIGFKDIIITSLMIVCFIFTALPWAHSADPRCIEGNCDNGMGTFVSSDGTKYVGEFKNGKYNGQGIWTSADGGRYVGHFKDQYFNGQGTWTYADGRRYVGEFKDGNFNGQGTWAQADGGRYVGEFKNGKYNGQGTRMYADGSRYVGEFKEYKYHGQGAYTWPDGVVFEGTFDDNMPQPPFELLLPDGTKQFGKISRKVKITNVAENSQAQSIGLKKDDIVIEYNKDIAMNAVMLLHLISQTKPEDNVSMLIRREGKDLRFSLKGGKIGISFQDHLLYSLQDKVQKVAATSSTEIELPSETNREDIVDSKSAIPSKEVFGKYYALVIGNNNYTYLPKLKTAKKDAQVVSNVLKNNYGFQVTLLTDAKRSDILSMFAKLRDTLSSKDNLLIYYAGHGFLDAEGDEGYWLPVDATKDNEVYWISNSTITTQLKAMQAKHVLVIADSCYSGKLGRDVHIVRRTPDYYFRIAQKRTRSVIASGGLEPVIDSGGKGNHSVFASALISALLENNNIIDTSELFAKIRRPVVLHADQTPEYADIRKAGHEGGEFVFIRDK
ncbi:MAG TPA: caspase family protein [Smithellaceae bacterium]|nr:caspase family protein [Smithellaceae bacterium]